jgi:lipoprotein NlpD
MNSSMSRDALFPVAAALAALVTLVTLLTMGGCASRQSAPVTERPPGAPPGSQGPATAQAPPVRAADPRPENYIVKRGDTLYGIALDHGLDYRELAEWNGISNPNVIRVGDALRLRAPATASEGAAQTRPVTGAGAPESRPLGAGAEAPSAARKPDEATIARMDPRRPEVKPEVKPEIKPELKPEAKPKADAPAPAPKSEAPGDDDEKVDWAWPVSGKLVARFVDPGNKGVDIAAKLGDPVHASAPGRVVYSGSGLRGYGKLVIIKHNPTYLSAYAHNNQILVKEGQNVARGQKIGEVGATDTDAPKLHFEIRRMGKPVDPLKFLPERRS